MQNPFELVTASKLSAKDAIDLWCDDKRLARVWLKENCFINGHRGTGKSMLFRVLQYDCQKLLYPGVEPDFLSIYFSVRDSELSSVEVDALLQDEPQRNILSESQFTLLLLRQLFLILKEYPTLIHNNKKDEVARLVQDSFNTAYRFCSNDAPTLPDSFDTAIDSILNTLKLESQRLMHYIGLNLYVQDNRFDGPLFLFDTLLGPIADYFKKNINKTVYILVDDGDDLPESHTIILNTWIARRNDAVVFKVSTMFGYKTFRTKGRSAIQHPHDFTQYDIATRYISDFSEDYLKLVHDIVKKRLKNIGVEIAPEAFFPVDQTQQDELDKLATKLTEEYSKIYKGRAIKDNVYRHLTSEYLKVLNKERSSEHYSYSGFKVLATLSSGMVRDFIICAQKMFDNASRRLKSDNTPIKCVPPDIQNQIVRLHADEVLSEISNANQKRTFKSTHEDWKKVKQLVEGLGNLFKSKMLSSDSERRVFSFAFQDEPSEEVERLLNLAIGEGYLMKGFISRKEGTGRRVLYVMTRRLAPAYNLDVLAYAGYLSLRTERVKQLIDGRLERKEKVNSDQLAMFDSADAVESIFDGDLDGEIPAMVPSDQSIWIIISPEEAGQ